MIIERCEQCGFDGARWTDLEAMTAIASLPAPICLVLQRDLGR